MSMKNYMKLRRSLATMNEDNTIKIDKKKAASLIRKIIIAESKNIKNEEKSDAQMVSTIKKMIQSGRRLGRTV